MQSYSEIECAFICKQFSIVQFIDLCRFLCEKKYKLNESTSGYVSTNYEFEYPKWNNIVHALEYIKTEKHHLFCINLSSLDENAQFPKVTIEAEPKYSRVSIIVGEEFLVNKKENKIDKKLMSQFVDYIEGLSSYLDVELWKIAQSGFEYEEKNLASFSFYSNNSYPKTDINRLINWYDKVYLTRWNNN